MKLKYGGVVTDARGSIGGITFSRNHYGPYARARTTPVQPNTDRQAAVKASIAFLSAMWAGTLTAVQRTAWNLYASSVAMTDKLGATMFLTGYNHFMRSNTINKNWGLALISDGPTVFELPAHDPTFDFTASEATQAMTVTYDATMAWAVEDGGYIFLNQGKPQNAQRNFFDGPWRFYNSIAGIDPGGPVTPDVSAGPFAIAEGQHLWIFARIMRADGRLSTPFRADTFCLA